MDKEREGETGRQRQIRGKEGRAYRDNRRGTDGHMENKSEGGTGRQTE